MRALWQLTYRAAWALGLVFLLRAAAFHFKVRAELDNLIHFSGGLAMAYFIYHALQVFAGWIGPIRPFVRYLLIFSLSCTVALFWEFGELFSDRYFRTHIQTSVLETMGDLISGTCGAFATVSLIAVVQLTGRLLKKYTKSARGGDPVAAPETREADAGK